MAENLAKDVLDLYLRAEATMLERVAKRIERGIDSPGWTGAKLAEIQTLRREIEAEVARLTEQGAEATSKAVGDAYNRGVATAGTDLRAVGVSRELAFGSVNLRAVDALAQQAAGILEGTHLRILRSTMDGYRDVITQASGDVLSGTVTRREAAQRALDNFGKRGITGFVDRAGRNWDLASYAEATVRTATGRAAVDGHLGRLLEVGQDLVIVSDAPQECAICRPWEGKVLSISGQTRGTVRSENLRGDGTVSVTVAGSMADARADGLFHINCRHTVNLYQPGVTRPMTRTADPQGDADRQELRRLERGTREWKRRSAVAITPEAQRQAKAKVGDWQAKIRDHTSATTAKRQRSREQIGKAR